MSQIQIEITDAQDQKRFDDVLAQTVDWMLSAEAQAEAMISVHTESCFDHLIKIIKCSTPDALTFFARTYDECAYHA